MTERSAVTDIRRHLCETSHGYIHMRSAGEGGTPIVCLHKGQYSSRQFRHILPLLADTAMVIAVDRLGYGMSDAAASRPSMAEYAATTLEALDAIGVEEFDVVGSHTGSTEAVELATRFPQRVRRVVIAGAPLWVQDERVAMLAHYGGRGNTVYDVKDDGSHLLAIWNRVKGTGEGRHYNFANPTEERLNAAAPAVEGGGWDAEQIHGVLVDQVLAGPNWWWRLPSVLEYPFAERFAEVAQPLLLCNMQDDLWENSKRARAILPPQGEYRELAHLDIHAFEYAPEEMAGYLREFFA